MRAELRWEEDRQLPPSASGDLTGPGAPWEMAGGDVLGRPMRVFARRPRSVRAMLESAAERFGERPFLVFPDRTLTYGGVLEPVAALAASLADRFGIGPGSRVAIASANNAGHALAAWAAASVGAVVVELNGWWAGGELLFGIDLTEPSVVIGDRRRLERIPDGSLDAPVVCIEDDMGLLEKAGEGRPLPPDVVHEDDPLVVLFTSGTTGRAKGAVLSHRAHVHMMMQATLQGLVNAAREPVASTAATASHPCTIAVSPMFHISGFSVALIGGPYLGATFVYPEPGRWDPEVHLDLTERHRASAWSVVPTLLWRLLEHPRLAEFDLSSVRRIGGGGATFQPELWRRVREQFPQVAMSTGYGMTETCGAGTHQDGQAAREHPDAVGAPVPGYEIRVLGPDGQVVDEGETGQIALRGPCNMLGYRGDPAATEASIDGDRWFHTGEVGHVEHGLLYLDGRRSDVIVRGGENIYAGEVENRLVEHPAISEAAVVGVADRSLGEEVKAVVVLRPGTTLSGEDVRAWVAESLASFKVPSQVEVVDELPHNAAGKVLKNLLVSPGDSGLVGD